MAADPAAPGPQASPQDPAPDGGEVEVIERAGQRLVVRHYAGVGAGPAVLVLPAIGVPGRYYLPFAQALARHGVAPSVVDLRGHGESTPATARGDHTGYADLADDVDAAAHRVRARNPGRPLLLLGHSLGGQLALVHLARRARDGAGPRTAVDGLVLVAVGLPYWRDHDPPARWALLPFTQAMAGLAGVWGVTPAWTFVGRQPAGVMRDWARTARTGRLGKIGDLDVDAALAGVGVPVLGVTVEHDRLTPPRTLDRLLALLPGARVQRHHYTSDEAGARVDHLRWARAGDALAARVARFALTSPPPG